MSKSAFTGLLLSSLFIPPALAIIAAPLPADGPRLVIYPPWEDGPALIQRAGGDPVGPYTAPMGLLAFAPDGAEFDRRLRAAGAWAVIDGRPIAQACGVEPELDPRGKST